MSTISENVAVVKEYMDWLQSEMKARLKKCFPSGPDIAVNLEPLSEPVYFDPLSEPQISSTNAELPAFIKNNQLSKEEQLVLILALAPHVDPLFLERIIHSIQINDKFLPYLGGYRGEQFNRFLPNGETAFLLLAGNDIEKRAAVKTIFGDKSILAKQGVLFLEPPHEGEPLTAGKLVFMQDYVDLFLTGISAPPKLGSNFPAEYLSTDHVWNDLVLNNDTMNQIEELKKWLRKRKQLLALNKRVKKGYKVLFHGPPGTGKTMAASLLGSAHLANGEPAQKNLDVYRIDLSLVVSKFIGETEKSLSALFDKAENKNWILFFDEADALFGKRTGIRDAHDKYANQEVSYLLQRIEDYNGIVILASNFKSNLDQAFLRRFQAIIHFPPPNANERLSIWKTMITDDMLEQKKDLEEIAYSYDMTGASIVNTAQYCFLKHMTEDGNILPLKKTDLEEAILREYNKEGKILK